MLKFSFFHITQNEVSYYTYYGDFFKCPLYTYIEVKLKICYYGGFSKILYFNNKRGVSIYMGIWEWKEVPKTDKN